MLRAFLLTVLFSGGLWAQNYAVASGSSFSFNPVAAPTVLSLGDDALSGVQSPAGFSFSYFGQSYNSFLVGSNGYIIMGTQGTTTAATPAHATAPGLVIAPFWGDFKPQLNVQIGWSQVAGKLVVEWLAVRLATPTAGGGPYNVDIQIILDTSTGVIEFNYGGFGGTGMGPTSVWPYTCSLSGSAGGGQAIVPGNYGSFISSTGAIPLWPLLAWVKFTPVITPNNPPVLSLTRNGAPVTNGAMLPMAQGALVADQNFVIAVDDNDGDSVTVTATISNLGATGLLESEFSNAGAFAPYALTPQAGAFVAPSAAHLFTLNAQDGQGGAASLTFTVIVSAAAGGPALGAGPGGGCTAGDEGEALPVFAVIVRSAWNWAKRHPLQASAVAALAMLALCTPAAVMRHRRRSIQI